MPKPTWLPDSLEPYAKAAGHAVYNNPWARNAAQLGLSAANAAGFVGQSFYNMGKRTQLAAQGHMFTPDEAGPMLWDMMGTTVGGGGTLMAQGGKGSVPALASAGKKTMMTEAAKGGADDIARAMSGTFGKKVVRIPISEIAHGESAMPGGKLTWPGARKLIKEYADRPTDFPPITLNKVDPDAGDFWGGAKYFIEDGSHRLEAAKLRGDKFINATIDHADDVLAVPAATQAAAQKQATQIAKQAGTTATPLKNAQLPNIRRMSIAKATAIASKEPHLIPKSGGKGFVGAPPGIETYDDVLRMRAQFDARVKASLNLGPQYEGKQHPMYWYDRYRNSMNEVTGKNPHHNNWMSPQHGLWSQGVDPGSETQFVLKENNAALAGMPQKAMYGAQHEKHLSAIAKNDVRQYNLGKKTGEYGFKLNPNKNAHTAVGTNDFRAGREWGYPVGAGTGKTSLTQQEHTFLDYETALAVKRANEQAWGGRTDWTGERIQAAPWVFQKAEAIGGRRFESKIRQTAMSNWDDETAMLAGRDLGKYTKRESTIKALPEANKQIGDYFDKHTWFGTHEAQPGVGVGRSGAPHLPGSANATAAERAQFAEQGGLSTWANAPGDRDAIYSGLQLGDTGVAMRVRPSLNMTGNFEGQANPGWVARPLVAFDTLPTGGKTTALADKKIIEAAEALRGVVDAQDFIGSHKVWTGGPMKYNKSMYFPQSAQASPAAMSKAIAEGARHGLPDVADTGMGMTFTDWSGNFLGDKAARAGQKALAKSMGDGYAVSVDSVSKDLRPLWQKGKGAVTKYVLKKVNATPELRAAFDNNPYLAQNALNRIERDKAWLDRWGVGRKDIETFRRIIADGRGWVGRMEKVLKENPEALPALAFGVIGLASQAPSGSGEQ